MAVFIDGVVEKYKDDPPNYQPGRALVKRDSRGHNLVSLDPERIEACRTSLQKVSQQDTGMLNTLAFLCYFGGNGLYAWGAFEALTEILPLKILSSIIILSGIALPDTYLSLARNCVSRTVSSVKPQLKEVFKKAQKEAYQQYKTQYLNAADEMLQAGRKLEFDDVACLARLNAQALSEASDELAITVLNARRMLAYTSCTKLRADGRPAVTPAPAASALGYDLKNKTHSAFLRQILESADQELPEDDDPEWEEPDFSKLDELAKKACEPIRPNIKKGFLRTVAAPLFVVSDVLAVRKSYKMLREFSDFDQEVKIPSLSPVPDFAARLAQYEQMEAPLDLPAFRDTPKGNLPNRAHMRQLPL